ncbi:flagellar basal body-associated FliL family protein [Vallitalea guaymasensis]|uniref:Flagellar protein FliL n=1 Tax=Vallitalea guaymasensis TaxID=1185412 RepID=A0A8J8SE74_9FIRM|nr:flagellar basal body-associated FliL family protein [Vallitalea guaymasensis]QUH31449.1 flagellar basal body-associated FliL family protein [Vallitalea guaymasensis]
MAKEKKVKVKSEKDNGKLVLMIGVILIVCSVILLGISVFILKPSGNSDKAEQVKDPDKIPLSQIESYETENMVVILPSIDNPDKRMSFTFYVGFALDKKSKDLKDTKTLLEESKGIIKSRISTLLSSKYSEDMLKQDSQQMLSDEIFAMMEEILDTDALVEVYIRDFLYR